MKELAEISHFLSRSVEIILYIFKNFPLKRTFEPQNNLPGVLLKTNKAYF